VGPLKTTLALLALLLAIPLLFSLPVAQASAVVPTQTDDGLDPVNLIFTGAAPAAWVAQNLNGWNPSSCSEPKILNGRTYDFNLETQGTCWGTRYHIRIWDMGTDPVLGQWSIGAVHHEHVECTLYIFSCHHVIDSWEQAEALVRSTFASGTVALSISNYPLNNSGLYQGIYNDGNATLIRLANTSLYPVTFLERGLPAHTPWSVTLNGTTSSSTDGNITIRSPKGEYSFRIVDVPGYRADVLTGSFNLTGNRMISIRFTSTQTFESMVSQPSVEFFLLATVGGWSGVFGAAALVGVRRRRNRK